MNWRGLAVCVMLAALCLITWFALEKKDRPFQASLTSKQEVVFWHFWGGEDRDVVDDVVRRFNESQEQYFVRSIAMPGNNLQAKLFLSVAGGDPPDLVNQDDPVIADWGERGVIKAIDEIIPDEDVQSLESWMFDSARRLTTYQGRLYGICNGLDIRALYFNQTVLDRFGFQPPKTIEELSAISTTISGNGDDESGSFAYLPDSRRLWAWGYVFGADFYDSEIADVQVDSPEVINALRWMTSFSKKFGPDNIIAYRKGDQSLPGKAFPLLPVSDDELVGRYSILMDGQWRVRNIVEFQKDRQTRGLAVPKFGVCPLPIPKDSTGRERAGWVNGNFFVVPKNAKNAKGAVEFAKFWIGFNSPVEAARTCADGGWIPVSSKVAETKVFQDYTDSNPLFAQFVNLAKSKNQFPIPQVVGASMFRRTVESAAYRAITNPDLKIETILRDADQEIQIHLDRVNRRIGNDK